jgi:hypothetical protein
LPKIALLVGDGMPCFTSSLNQKIVCI